MLVFGGEQYYNTGPAARSPPQPPASREISNLNVNSPVFSSTQGSSMSRVPSSPEQISSRTLPLVSTSITSAGEQSVSKIAGKSKKVRKKNRGKKQAGTNSDVEQLLISQSKCQTDINPASEEDTDDNKSHIAEKTDFRKRIRPMSEAPRYYGNGIDFD